MIDVATGTVTAAVLRPTTKSVDASVLLARTLTPEPMRPGWADALAMSRSLLPHRRLLAIDQRLEQAAARPVIVPETIVADQRKVVVSRNFRASCAALGIDFQPTPPGSPAEKPHIEKMMSSVRTLFAQLVSGYTGSNTERRGRRIEAQPLWSTLELHELLDEWIIVAWRNRPHDGLRDPAAAGRMFTPNEKYTVLVEAAGYVPVALSAEDYIGLLPAFWKAVNAYGVKLKYRTYDAAELNPLRRQTSGVTARRNLWDVHYDPYDVSRSGYATTRAAAGSPCSGNTCAATGCHLESWPGITCAARCPPPPKKRTPPPCSTYYAAPARVRNTSRGRSRPNATVARTPAITRPVETDTPAEPDPPGADEPDQTGADGGRRRR